jgi:hypothetical protein
MGVLTIELLFANEGLDRMLGPFFSPATAFEARWVRENLSEPPLKSRITALRARVTAGSCRSAPAVATLAAMAGSGSNARIRRSSGREGSKQKYADRQQPPG